MLANIDTSGPFFHPKKCPIMLPGVDKNHVKIHENHGFWHGFGHLFDTSGAVLAPPNILGPHIGTLWAHPPTSGQTPQKGCPEMSSKTSIFGHFGVSRNVSKTSIFSTFLTTFWHLRRGSRPLPRYPSPDMGALRAQPANTPPEGQNMGSKTWILRGPDVSKTMFFGQIHDLETSKMTPFWAPFGGIGDPPKYHQGSPPIIWRFWRTQKSAKKGCFLEDPQNGTFGHFG